MMRRRATAGIKPRPSVPVLMTRAQLATFESFHRTTLKDGSLTFDWLDHTTNPPAACVYAFTGPYAVETLGTDAFLVRLPLEIRP